MSQKTSFARWRHEMNLSLHEAAQLLGLSPAQIVCLNRGASANGNPAVPKFDTRLLMQAVADKLPLRPWELTPEEMRVLEVKTRRRRDGARRARVQEAA
jgi:hypothetical protein